MDGNIFSFGCSVQLLSRVLFVVTSWTAAHQISLSNTNSWSLLKLMSIESVMSSNHLILSRPLLLLPSIFPSIRVFSDESVLHIRWPEYWSFSFSISSSNEYSRLISFRMDWLDLLAVQGTLKSFPQFVVIHTVKNFGIVNKAEVDIFLELSCFFDDPADVDNLISGSSAFSKTSLNIWKFTVHVVKLKSFCTAKEAISSQVIMLSHK